MGVRKKCPKMSQVSHANDGFVWLSENVCVRLGNQPAQPARSKGLYDVDGLAPSQCLNWGRKMVLEVPVSLQWLRQEFRVSRSSADACMVDTWSEMRWNLSKITPVANVWDAFTALQHCSGRPATVWGAGAAAFGARVGDSAPLWDPASKRVEGGCTLSLHRGFLSAVWWPHAELVYASDIWEIWVCSAMPYKGISAEHASIMPVGYYLYNPFGLDYLLYWNLFHIRGWERAVLLNLLVPWGGERTVCLWGVGSSPKTSPCWGGWSSWHGSSLSLWFAILQSFPMKVLQKIGRLVR